MDTTVQSPASAQIVDKENCSPALEERAGGSVNEEDNSYNPLSVLADVASSAFNALPFIEEQSSAEPDSSQEYIEDLPGQSLSGSEYPRDYYPEFQNGGLVKKVSWETVAYWPLNVFGRIISHVFFMLICNV